MTDYTIFEIVAVVLAIPLCYLLAYAAKYVSRPNYKNDIDEDFQREWNGTPEDKYYAWIRLRNLYLHYDSPTKYIGHIQFRMEQVNRRSFLSSTLVDHNGELIEHNSAKKKL
ncbi:MAG: hypothetical protein ACNA78_08780 [Balneolaceae bacterium]